MPSVIYAHTQTAHAVCFLMCPLVLTRFLVHRYSVMREHVEANKIEGVDDIDAHYMETGKTQYNEDSDQVSNRKYKVLYWLDFVIVY